MKEHPVFARFWDFIAPRMGKEDLENREEVTHGATGRVLEIGSGTGLNFRLYPEGVSVVAIEPEPNMVARAVDRAERAPVSVRMVRAVAEALPFKDGVFYSAVVTLTFCSMTDPAGAAAEVRRVLRPGAELRFYEHVRSTSPRAARWQDRVLPVWRYFGAGCHPNRDTVATFREVGFDVRGRRGRFGPPSPARPHVIGTAKKR